MEINTKFCMDLQEIQNNYDLGDYSLNDIATGYDNNIYLLYVQCVDEDKNLKKCRNVKMRPNWQNGGVDSIELLDLGAHDIMYPVVQPIGENILLLGSRCCQHADGHADNNAVIINKSGEVVRDFCLGDGIEQCFVTSDGKIITSYFDEGVFGNYGWNYPIGSSGVIIWNEFGEKIWENTLYPVYDCYIMNIDNAEKLWFYYYDEFKIVRCGENEKDEIYDPEIDGGNFMMIADDGNTLIMDCGYDKHSDFKLIQLGHDGKCVKKTVEFVHENKPLLIRERTSRSNRAIFYAKEAFGDGDYGLYIAELEI